ncbi:hypothetical protein DLAC_10730 [Tieghemostelium lacteum]|uniref:Uncharacterized protein n=1 Tax=Tieghemostelium lacteum TaxID=361077 RepID=A0A151Z422_TIELA|nr:hypothetical protein DLAC_10730 [Tieghemostelium lacteum]|eukprot:KYQ88709.1 hypothetical protein DLAC_10730 [Tieghemostelium lacteum]
MSTAPKKRGNNREQITDKRFSTAQYDPKFKIKKREDNTTKLDPRFKKVLSGEFNSKAKIDEYGRRIDNKKTNNKSVQKTYTFDDDEEKEKLEEKVVKKVEKPIIDSSDSESDKEVLDEDGKNEVVTYGGFEYNSDTESSDYESSDEDVESEEEEDEEDEEDIPRGDAFKRFAVMNCDWENITSKDLFVLLNSFVPKGGYLVSVTVYPSDFGLEQLAAEKALGPSHDIFAKSDSKKPIQTKPSSSTITLEKQAKGTMEVETFDGAGFDLEKLRKYELSKLKYYYAIVECDSVQTASTIYDECEGMEIEDTANVLDLRFVPDDQEFKNEPRDTCTELPVVSPNFNFETNVLKGTVVDFTWDQNKQRKKMLTKNFSKDDVREEDLKAYLAEPESSDDSEIEGENSTQKKLTIRNKYASLLSGLTGDQEEKDDIKITFNSAFSDNKKTLSDDSDEDVKVKFDDQEMDDSDSEDEMSGDDDIVNGDNESDMDEDREDLKDMILNGSDEDDEDVKEITITPDLEKVGKNLLKEKKNRESASAWEEYQQKKKDKKAQKKKEKKLQYQLEKEKEEDSQKSSRQKKKRGNVQTEEEKRAAAEMELILMDDQESGNKRKGYNKKSMEIEAKLNSIDPKERKRQEKKLQKKNQKGDKGEEKLVNKEEEGFKFDSKDVRINKIFSDPNFAIDPTDPKFQRRNAMVELLNEKKSRRAQERNQQEYELLQKQAKESQQTATSSSDDSNFKVTKDNLAQMTQNIKRKAETHLTKNQSSFQKKFKNK